MGINVNVTKGETGISPCNCVTEFTTGTGGDIFALSKGVSKIYVELTTTSVAVSVFIVFGKSSADALNNLAFIGPPPNGDVATKGIRIYGGFGDKASVTLSVPVNATHVGFGRVTTVSVPVLYAEGV